MEACERLAINLRYGDYEGGQPTITRFNLTPHDTGQWLTTVSRHGNVDRDDPR